MLVTVVLIEPTYDVRELCASRQKPPSVSVCWLRQHASSQLTPPRATRSAPVAWALRARRMRRARSPPRATRSALGTRRCAPRALRACVPGRPGRRSVPLAAIAASRYALGADGVGAARPGAYTAAQSRPRALRARRRWRRRCTPERLHVLPPDNARVASWWWGGRRRRRALCADRDAWCKARFALLPRGRVGRGVSDIIMHERAGQRLRATAACSTTP